MCTASIPVRFTSSSSHRQSAPRSAAAAGGFQANLEWLREIWGEAADNFIVRGTPYNTGTILKLMLDAGAPPEKVLGQLGWVVRAKFPTIAPRDHAKMLT